MLVVSGALDVLFPACLPAEDPVFMGLSVLLPETNGVLAVADGCDDPVMLILFDKAPLDAEAEGANESKTREVSIGERLAEVESGSEDYEFLAK